MIIYILFYVLGSYNDVIGWKEQNKKLLKDLSKIKQKCLSEKAKNFQAQAEKSPPV